MLRHRPLLGQFNFWKEICLFPGKFIGTAQLRQSTYYNNFFISKHNEKGIANLGTDVPDLKRPVNVPRLVSYQQKGGSYSRGIWTVDFTDLSLSNCMTKFYKLTGGSSTHNQSEYFIYTIARSKQNYDL